METHGRIFKYSLTVTIVLYDIGGGFYRDGLIVSFIDITVSDH
jgi:hypothetical protein